MRSSKSSRCKSSISVTCGGSGVGVALKAVCATVGGAAGLTGTRLKHSVVYLYIHCYIYWQTLRLYQ